MCVHFRNQLHYTWMFVCWLGVALIVLLSLTPQPPPIPSEQGDKVGHLLAYGVLTCWWMQLFVGARQRYVIAAAFVVLGIALEFMQGSTTFRFFSYADMGANVLGVVFGWLAAPPRLPNAYECMRRLGGPKI